MSSQIGPRDSGEFFVQVALENELMTPDQTQTCLDRRKALIEEGDRSRMEDIVVALGILSREQASLVTRGTNYLCARQEDLLLAKAIQAQGLATDTDVQYALTLQDALYQHEDQAVPRLLELLQEDEVIGEDAVPQISEALEEIQESLKDSSGRVEDDPAVEYEVPQTDEEQQGTEDAAGAAVSDETERAQTEDESADTDFMDEMTGGGSGRELAADPTMPLAGSLAEEPNDAPSEGSECRTGGDDDATEEEGPTTPSNGRNGTALDDRVDADPKRIVPLAPAPLRRQKEEEKGDDEEERTLSAEEKLQAAVERRQADMAPPLPKKKRTSPAIKRTHERFEVRDATIHFAGDSLFSSLDLFEKPSHIVNMSMGGLSMLTRRPLAIGERIKMVLHIPVLGDDLHAKGEVRSVNTIDKYTQHFRVGVKFLKLSSSARQNIQRLVKDPTLRHKGKFRRYSQAEDF